MRLGAGIQSALRDESGAGLVLFALFAPVAILLVSVVIDVSNSLLHARHLQVQADAAALSAAQQFQGCFNGSKAAEESNASIYARAGQYGGVTSVSTPSGSVNAATPLYNQQIGGTPPANVHGLVNSSTFFDQSSPVDTTVESKSPCEAGMVDVKLTETNLPWYVKVFKSVFNGVPFINAQARVQVLQQVTGKGVEPLAVAESAPLAAKAYFVNEDNNNAVLGSVELKHTETNGQGQDVWSNVSTPLPLSVKATNSATPPTAHIGVLIALSGNASHTKCGEAYVQCFDQTTGPLLHIAGYSKEGKGSLAAPIAHQVALSTPAGDTCTDAYFSNAAGSCTFTVTASVDFGTTNLKGMSVTPEVKGVLGKPLTPPKTSTEPWVGLATLTAASGSNEINLVVECNSKTKESPCEKEKKNVKGTIKDVQRAYAANFEHNSGTITGAWVGDAKTGATQDADSFEVCETADANSCPHEFVVTVDVAGSLSDAAGYEDKLRQLRYEGEQGVRVGCPPPAKPSGNEYRLTLTSGCPGTYRLNTSDSSCAVNTEPYECLSVGLPGKDTGPTNQGIDERIENRPQFYCPNNWRNNNNGGVPILPANDSRIIELFVIPFGTLDSEGRSLLGNEEVPIQNFAAFYVTGFPGDKCASDPSTGNAEIVGHFIKYINTVNGSGEKKCATSSFGNCVVVLTR